MTAKTDKPVMARITIGYRDYVMTLDDAAAVAAALSRAERYETLGYGDTRTVHCWPMDGDDSEDVTIKTLGYSLYRAAQLAGKPERK